MPFPFAELSKAVCTYNLDSNYGNNAICPLLLAFHLPFSPWQALVTYDCVR